MAGLYELEMQHPWQMYSMLCNSRKVALAGCQRQLHKTNFQCSGVLVQLSNVREDLITLAIKAHEASVVHMHADNAEPALGLTCGLQLE